MKDIKKIKIMVIGFGGTIAMIPDAHSVLRPAKNIKEILNMIPSLKKMANLSFFELENLDSTNINPNHWSRLALFIKKIHNKTDAIIVTHGTDTMAYTASAISLALGRGLKIPVVFTGSQLPLVAEGSDAKFNMENSVKAAIQASTESIAEVMIVFSDRVLRANRTLKTSEAKFPAFDSPAFPHLALIDALGIHFIPQALKVDKKLALDVKANFKRGILAIDLTPGLEPKIFLNILKSGECKGLLLKSLGAGNIPNKGNYSLITVIKKAVKTFNLPVLVSTKFIGGNTHMNMYEPGESALRAGALPTGDMTDVMAQVKFMWALGQGYRSIDKLRKVIDTDFVGEITS